jgi:hypothetical protein
MRVRRLAVIAAAIPGVCGAAASAARASPASVAVEFDCPALDGEGQAVLEARARADFAARRVPEGRLTIACRGTSAHIAWRPSEGDGRTAAASLPQDPAAAVDELLEAVHVLVFEAAEGSSPRATDSSASSALPEGSSPAEPREQAATQPRPAAVHAVRSDSDAFAVQPGDARAAMHVGFAAAAHSEVWSGAIGGAVGAHAGVRLALPGLWRVTLLAGPSWGTASASGLHAWSASAVARVERELVRHVELGLGLAGEMLWVDGAPQAFTQSQLDALTAGAVVRAAYRTSFGPVDLSLGPELAYLLRPVIVEVSGREVFRLPTLLAGLSLDASSF